MGDAAYERAATADEIERMCELVREAHRRGRRRVLDELLVRAPRRRRQAGAEPLRRARTRSMRCSVPTGATGKGVVLITPGQQCSYADVYEWQPQIGRPFTYPLFAAPGGRHLEPVRLHERGLGARRRRVAAGDAPAAHDAVHDGRPLQPQHRHGVRRAAAGEPRGAHRRVPRSRVASPRGRRPRALADEAALGDVRGLRVGAVPRAGGPAGERARARSAAAARSTSCASCRWPRTSRTRFRAYIANDDVDAVGRLLTHDHVALGLSDAGAHVDQLCDAPLPTDLLGRWVREREVMPLEQAVRKLTGEPADMFGFVAPRLPARGLLGRRVRVRSGDGRPRPDAAGARLPRRRRAPDRRGADGVRHVLVNGTPIRRDDVQVDLGGSPPGVRPEIA